MNPIRVRRDRLIKLTDLPNIGPACADDLKLLGIDEPTKLRGRNPYELYEQLCTLTAQRHDPCVMDVFISNARCMDGKEPQAWWKYTALCEFGMLYRH
jgi:hypothetical protein